jgi:hypothetical protein
MEVPGDGVKRGQRLGLRLNMLLLFKFFELFAPCLCLQVAFKLQHQVPTKALAKHPTPFHSPATRRLWR